MAKPDKMPQRSIIDGFKGLVDFYYWKGVPVARSWPQYTPRTPGPAEAANQADFAYINKLYSTLPALVLHGLIQLASGTTQTPKDYLVRAYLKGLFTLMPPEYYATEETAQEISDRIGAVDGSDPGSAIDRLADLLTELNAKLEPTHLNIEAGSLDLQVDDKSDYLNQGNVYLANRWGAHASGAGWTDLINASFKGLIGALDFATDYKSTQLLFQVDGQLFYILSSDGHSADYFKPEALHEYGGETSLLIEANYDDVNDLYSMYLKSPLQLNSSIRIAFRQESGVAKMIAISLRYRVLY